MKVPHSTSREDPAEVLSDKNWRCSTCGSSNAGGMSCPLCGTDIALSDAAAASQDAGPSPERVVPVERELSLSPSVSPLPPEFVLSFGLRAWTGMVTAVEQRAHLVLFRLAMPVSQGEGARDYLVHCDTNRSDVFVQVGERVTVIGRARAGVIRDPMILNHSGLFKTIPGKPPKDFTNEIAETSRWWVKIIWVGLIMCLVIGFGMMKLQWHLPAAAMWIWAIPAELWMGYHLCWQAWWLLSGGPLRSWAMDRVLAALGEGWKPLPLWNQTATVEAVLSYSRGRIRAVPWICFRTVFESSDGSGPRWIVGAIPRGALTADMRIGDKVLWKWRSSTTGRINRRPEIEHPAI